MIPVYGAWTWCIFIAGFDCVSRFLGSVHSELTLQFTLEGVLLSKTLQVGKFSFFITQAMSALPKGNTGEPSRVRETIFLFALQQLLDIFIEILEEVAFNLGVHPLRGQKSFQSVMVGLILKHGYRSQKKKKSSQ